MSQTQCPSTHAPPLPQNAGLQDVLMDRAVMNKANLRNANLERTVRVRDGMQAPGRAGCCNVPSKKQVRLL